MSDLGRRCGDCGLARVLEEEKYYWCESRQIPITTQKKSDNIDRANRCLEFRPRLVV